ncbi:MAG: hypothetical protein L6R41_007987 [Letrouitia leprolyta]|nr:MAG: hypothetical protein L6R41_007987 [Letrouitia leprolyta]
MSWLWRGFQSAVFYYVSCAPCNELAHRRRRRKGAARSKTENEMQQGLYPHPSPFSTNIYWREEMSLGPGPPQKRRDRDKERQQRAKERMTSNECTRDLVTGSSAETGTSTLDTTTTSSSVQGVVELEQERQSGDNWNRRRYQREDEFLWGIDSASEAEDNYCTARNPAVNDLHPPVVSTHPTNPSETRWMLQPPPSARVMEGKERATRSRSGSGGSNGSSRRGEIGLGRQIGEKMVEKKRRKGQPSEMATEGASMTRATSNETSSSYTSTRGQRHDRDAAPLTRISTTDSESSAPISTAKIKPPPTDTVPKPNPNPPPQVSIPISNDNDSHRRPLLQTIISSSAISPVHSPSPSTKTSKPTLQQQTFSPLRPPLMQTTSTSSLRVLQELVSPSTVLNARPVSIPYPPALLDPENENEDLELELEIPEVESLWPPLPLRKGRGELGRGDDAGWGIGLEGIEGRRRQRWSMDI